MNEMQDKELATSYIEKYADLKQIINSDDPKKESARQINIVKAAFESMGIATTALDNDN